MTDREGWYERVFQHSLDGVVISRPDGVILRANPAACRIAGRSEAEILRVGRQALIADDAQVAAAFGKRTATGFAAGEGRIVRPDGSTVLVEYSTGLLPSTPADGELGYAIFRDVTERRRAEQLLRRTARALRLRTECSAAIVRCTSEAALLAEVCRAMVDVGGYRMAWVGLAETDARKTVRPVAHAGHEDGYLAHADIVWADEPNGRGPSGTAVRTGTPVVNRDFETDETLAPWRAAARQRGYRASTALPLQYLGERIGVLSVYSAQLEAFDDEEQSILAQLADDVAHGVHALRERNARMGADTALRTNEARLREAQGNAHIGSWLYLPGQPLVWSDETYELYQLPRDVPPTIEAVRAVVHPEDRDGKEAGAFARALASDATDFRAEFRVIRQNGQVRWLQAIGKINRAPDGSVIDAAGTVQDVTELKQAGLEAQRELAERKRAEADSSRLAAVIEQASEMVMVTDRYGAIQYVNPAFEAITGYTRAEVLGQNPRILRSGAQSPEMYRALWAVISSGKTWRGRLVNRKKDGSYYTEDAIIAPVRDDVGLITGYFALKRDITRDLSLEAQLLQAQKMEGIGRLAGGVAHDFNNLLSVILGCARFALEDLKPADPLREDLVEIERAGERAAVLTRQLLAFSRRQALKAEPLELNRIIGDMHKMLVRILGEDVELVEALAPRLGIVKADAGQIEQVIMNLAVNARDAMPHGGKLTIATTDVDIDAEFAAAHGDLAPGPQVCISVTDTGVGMDARTQARMFEPFFTTKEPGKGTGLGLSTVYGIVAQSGGRVHVYSEVGHGTTFSVYLPRVGAEAPAARPATVATRPHGAETVLVVEDDEPVRKIVRRVLEGAGYRVLVAANGGEGLILCEQHADQIQLVLSDVVMPLMSGPAFVERARKVRPGMKVLFMSGYTDDAIVRHGVLEGEVDFVNKPLNQAELLQRVREVLDRAPTAKSAGA